jgi:DNA-directed RNA polymerase specialized sigma24 family protein
VELDGLVDEYELRSGDLVELESALQRLEARDPEAVRLIELRFFGGCSMEETAENLGISVRQARRWWAAARVQLKHELERA